MNLITFLSRTDTSSCPVTSACQISNPSSTSYSVSNLTPGTLVHISVTAYVDYTGHSRRTSDALVVPEISKPAIPTRTTSSPLDSWTVNFGFAVVGTKSGWWIK